MGQPLGPAGVKPLKHLSVVVGLFAWRGVVGKSLVSRLHLVIVHLGSTQDRLDPLSTQQSLGDDVSRLYQVSLEETAGSNSGCRSIVKQLDSVCTHLLKQGQQLKLHQEWCSFVLY